MRSIEASHPAFSQYKDANAILMDDPLLLEQAVAHESARASMHGLELGKVPFDKGMAERCSAQGLIAHSESPIADARNAASQERSPRHGEMEQ